MEPWNNFSQFLEYIGTHYSNPHCLNGIEKGQWRAYSTEEVLRQVRHLALGLKMSGLPKGECVGLIALPSPRWTIAALAVIMAGGVVVPLFPNISDENFTFEVEQTGMHWIIVDRELTIPIFDQHRALFTHVVDLSSRKDHPNCISYELISNQGAVRDHEQPESYASLMADSQADSLASIIYTSGSTGLPKGVEHTQRSLLGHLHAHPWELLPDKDRNLSILPLAHIFGYTTNLLLLGWGVSIYYSNDIKNLGRVCQEVHPTILSVVPRPVGKTLYKNGCQGA